jgi:hypothetical protein
MTPMARGLPWLLIAALCGCVPYPAYRTTRPEVTLTIRDARQRPIEGARVTLVSTEPPFDVVKSQAELWTAADGVVRFSSERELRVEVLFLYRGPIRFWNWCVEKEGFVTYFSRGPRTKVFADESVVLLKAGPSKPCPAAFR